MRLAKTVRALAALAVVALVELILFAGYHHERWQKALLPRGDAQTARGEGLVIRCDGLSYYAWLRSLLIDGDWDFDNEFDEHNPLGDYVPEPTRRTALDRRADSSSVGPACAWAVLIVPAHCFLKALPPLLQLWTPDGYSLPYQLLVGAGTLLASLLGLGFLYGICRRYARPDRAALAAAVMTLGTPILFYSAIEVSMAHGIGTAALAALVWYWLTTYGSERPARWLGVGILVGLVALVRWQLVTFAVLPACECLVAFWSTCRAGPARLVWRPAVGLTLTALGTAVAFLPQMLAWRAVYGAWFVAPLPMAHNWFNPSWWQVLAAQDRGLFYWTPVSLLACLGYLLFFWRHHARSAGSVTAPRQPAPAGKTIPLALLFGAFLLQVYVLASLWGVKVYLGVAFGFRQLTESLVALAPGLALLLESESPRRYRWLGALSCLLILWNLMLICQYRYGLIPADAGTDPATLLANVGRLVRRKHTLLIGQVLVGPVLLALLLSWPSKSAGHRLRELAFWPGARRIITGKAGVFLSEGRRGRTAA
jgi:hypothetical protein